MWRIEFSISLGVAHLWIGTNNESEVGNDAWQRQLKQSDDVRGPLIGDAQNVTPGKSGCGNIVGGPSAYLEVVIHS